nr:MAG TPA: hypothetical protein [Caudoviricetes sp.]
MILLIFFKLYSLSLDLLKSLWKTYRKYIYGILKIC